MKFLRLLRRISRNVRNYWHSPNEVNVFCLAFSLNTNITNTLAFSPLILSTVSVWPGTHYRWRAR